ncbi:unnamed protein product [Musa textilis]
MPSPRLLIPSSSSLSQVLLHRLQHRKRSSSVVSVVGVGGGREMADWGPVFVAVVLFVLLSPGLLFQIPGKGRVVEFGSLQTSGVAIFIHSIIFLGLAAVFMLVIGIHVYLG